MTATVRRNIINDLMDRMDAVNGLIREEENRHEDEMSILLDEKEEIQRELDTIIDEGAA